MYHFFICLATIQSFFFGSFFQPQEEKLDAEILTSRFIVKSDDAIDSLVDMPFRASWWSRRYEYAWCTQFADEKAVVLDAACGVSHPFKWHLGQICKETWACDLDPRFESVEAIIQETYDDLGELCYTILVNNPRLYNQVNRINASIFSLPETMPKFDRIFCISVLEHLTKEERQKALAEFKRFLTPNGLLVLTVDYPTVTPQELIESGASIGLIPAGEVYTDLPSNRVSNGWVSIYRCVLKQQ